MFTLGKQISSANKHEESKSLFAFGNALQRVVDGRKKSTFDR